MCSDHPVCSEPVCTSFYTSDEHVTFWLFASQLSNYRIDTYDAGSSFNLIVKSRRIKTLRYIWSVVSCRKVKRTANIFVQNSALCITEKRRSLVLFVGHLKHNGTYWLHLSVYSSCSRHYPFLCGTQRFVIVFTKSLCWIADGQEILCLLWNLSTVFTKSQYRALFWFSWTQPTSLHPIY
jgi:hypothetical protein